MLFGGVQLIGNPQVKAHKLKELRHLAKSKGLELETAGFARGSGFVVVGVNVYQPLPNAATAEAYLVNYDKSKEE